MESNPTVNDAKIPTINFILDERRVTEVAPECHAQKAIRLVFENCNYYLQAEHGYG